MIIFFIFIVAIIYFVFTSYNQLQRNAQHVKACLSNIFVSTQKKINLVNQLIDVTKKYQENENLTHLTISDNMTQSNIAANHSNANSALVGIQGVIQQYPELKANQHYQSLMTTINEVENDISHQREKYNESVREFNIGRSTIPTVFIANILKFPEAPYLDFNQENTEQTLLKNFNTDHSERLTEIYDATKQRFIEKSQYIRDKVEQQKKPALDNEHALITKEAIPSQSSSVADHHSKN